MRAVVAWLRADPKLKSASLLIALLLWAWRSSEGNPDIELTLDRQPVTVLNLAKDLTVVSQRPMVNITLYGPRRTLEQLRAGDRIQPTVDLEGIAGPVWRSLPITVQVPEEVRVRAIEPAQWEVEVDELVSDVTEIVITTSGEPAGDMQAEEPRPSVHSATVRGPAKKVRRVGRVTGEIDLTGRTASFTETVELQPVDSVGERLVGLEVQPPRTPVSVTLSKVDTSRTMRVAVPLDNQPAAGFVIDRYEVEPTEVTVSGSASALAKLGEAVPTIALDVAGKQTSFVRDVPLVLETGLVAKPAQVRVRVIISPEAKP